MRTTLVHAKIFLLFVLIITVSGCRQLEQEAEYNGIVERVIDGDTIKLTNGERVRYIGINTPELHHPKVPVQYLAREAKEFNEGLVGKRNVRLEFDIQKRDVYGRLLAYVFVGETFVNARLIEEGYAEIFTFPPNVKYAEEFLKLEQMARQTRKGLWAD